MQNIQYENKTYNKQTKTLCLEMSIDYIYNEQYIIVLIFIHVSVCLKSLHVIQKYLHM